MFACVDHKLLYVLRLGAVIGDADADGKLAINECVRRHRRPAFLDAEQDFLIKRIERSLRQVWIGEAIANRIQRDRREAFKIVMLRDQLLEILRLGHIA